MNKLVAVLAIIIVVLSAVCGALFYQISGLQSESDLQNQIGQLENKMDDLESQINALEVYNSELKENVSDLESNLTFLQMEVYW